MCHRGVLRGPWCQSTHTHICVQRTVCVRRHLPESTCPMVTTRTFRVHCALFRVYRAWGATIGEFMIVNDNNVDFCTCVLENAHIRTSQAAVCCPKHQVLQPGVGSDRDIMPAKNELYFCW